MNNGKRRTLAGLLTAALVTGGALVAAPAAQAETGTKSLAEVLTAKDSFDTNGNNYDIVTKAVLTVLGAKPDSAVKVLTDGNTALTAFIPNDAAFGRLVKGLLGNTPATEEATFKAVATLGVPAIEQVLLYHVVPGATIMSADALKANGAELTTALTGKVIKVSVNGTNITLGDYDKLATDPKVILAEVDLNKGNKQVAHGIDNVLLPLQLLIPGIKPLSNVLTAKYAFDKNANDYDILTNAVLAVLKARPNSPVKVLTDGETALTAFIPNDRAFMKLVKALTGKMPHTERATFNAVAGLGIATVERVLRYHVVLGDPILAVDALQANGASLKTALTGKVIKVSVNGTVIRLGDYNKKLADAKVVLSKVDINKGNKQVAHGIDAVLLPTA